MVVNRPKDILAGLVFVLIGMSAFLGAQAYEVGSANRMGPGYLPAALGLVLTGLGMASLVNGLRNPNPDPIVHSALGPLALVTLSVIAFAFLIDRAGLVPALFALVFLSCAGRVFRHPLEVLLTFAGLTAFCVFLFVYSLGMQIPLFW